MKNIDRWVQTAIGFIAFVVGLVILLAMFFTSVLPGGKTTVDQGLYIFLGIGLVSGGAAIAIAPWRGRGPPGD